MRDWVGLGLFVLVCFAAGAVGSYFTTAALSDWYAALRKPAWNPPNWVFAPVWSALYLLMAVGAWLVWRRTGLTLGYSALGVFAVQLVLNVLWSALFFGMRSPGAGVIGIAALWGFIVVTIMAFARVTPAAAWLMAPYLAWVTFASALNLAIWRLNG